MSKKSRCRISVFLMMLMFLSIFPMAGLADVLLDETILNTDETKMDDESIDVENEEMQGSLFVAETSNEDSTHVDLDSIDGENCRSDQETETPIAVDDEEIEMFPEPDHEELADENEIIEEPTVVLESEQGDQENEDIDELDEGFEDSESFIQAPEIPEIPNPTIRLRATYDGDKLEIGAPVTIVAVIDGIPEGMSYKLQWRNNSSGEFRDAPGETGMSVTFVADEQNVNCSWQLVLKITIPEAEA